ncbi:hypothetical protein [Cryptosporangium minutisporangium]|uniref:hypothetical protein n=1 Tax=Cryptosporangium minutisporangium TaxID=113569 RepID=UPI0035EADA5F
MTQKTIPADEETKQLVKAAKDELSDELGVTVSQKDTVAKLAKRYLNERGAA